MPSQVVDCLDESIGIDVGVGPPDDPVGTLHLLLGRVGIRVAVVVLAKGVLEKESYEISTRYSKFLSIQLTSIPNCRVNSFSCKEGISKSESGNEVSKRNVAQTRFGFNSIRLCRLQQRCKLHGMLLLLNLIMYQ